MKTKTYIKKNGEAAELDATFFKKAKRGRPRKAAEDRKKRVTIMLDQDVIEYFKADGPGWQTRANTALRKSAGFEVFSSKSGINVRDGKGLLTRKSGTGKSVDVKKIKPRKTSPAKKRA